MRKLKSNKGFTLVEMLACVITLLLLAAICGMGMNLALKSYNESLYESESQMLESTLNLYISDILRHASDIETVDVPDGDGLKTVTGFYNRAYRVNGGTLAVPQGEEEPHAGKIVVYSEPESTAGEDGRTETLLVGENAYADTLYIDNFVLKYNEENRCFVGSYSIKSTVLKDADRVCTFTYRSVAEYE